MSTFQCIEYTLQIQKEGNKFVAHAMFLDFMRSGKTPDGTRIKGGHVFVECGYLFRSSQAKLPWRSFEEGSGGYPDLNRDDIQQAIEYKASLTPEQIYNLQRIDHALRYLPIGMAEKNQLAGVETASSLDPTCQASSFVATKTTANIDYPFTAHEWPFPYASGF